MSTSGATGSAPTGVTMAVTAKPKFIRPDFDRMPDELKQRPNWVLWVPIWNGSKWTKRPTQPSGYGAATTNPQHWSSFENTKRAYERAVQCGYIELRQKNKPIQRVPVGGVGFVFDGQPDQEGLVIAGVDFDKLTRGDEIYDFAAERLKRLGSYVEASVSGTGVHLLLKARPLASGIAHNGVEMYTAGRYFTMTGSTADTARPIVAAPKEFAALADELRNEAGKSKSERLEACHADAGLDDWIINSKPPPVLAALPRESLADGLRANIEEIRSAVLAIPPAAITTEADWMKLARGLAHEAALRPQDAEQLWEILDVASRSAPGYEEADNRSRWERYQQEALTHPIHDFWV